MRYFHLPLFALIAITLIFTAACGSDDADDESSGWNVSEQPECEDADPDIVYLDDSECSSFTCEEEGPSCNPCEGWADLTFDDCGCGCRPFDEPGIDPEPQPEPEPEPEPQPEPQPEPEPTECEEDPEMNYLSPEQCDKAFCDGPPDMCDPCWGREGQFFYEPDCDRCGCDPTAEPIPGMCYDDDEVIERFDDEECSSDICMGPPDICDPCYGTGGSYFMDACGCGCM